MTQRSDIWVECPVCRQLSGMQIVAARNEDAVSYECHDCGHVWKVARPAPPKDNRQR